MRFDYTSAVLLVFAFATTSHSLALPDTTPQLTARNNVKVTNLPTEDIYCVDVNGKWVMISPKLIEDSIDKAARSAPGSVAGYPSEIKAPKSVPGLLSTSKKVLHYPIAETSRGPAVFDGRNYGDEIRVFYTSGTKADPKFGYLGIATHARASSGQFVACGTHAQWTAWSQQRG